MVGGSLEAGQLGEFLPGDFHSFGGDEKGRGDNPVFPGQENTNTPNLAVQAEPTLNVV